MTREEVIQKLAKILAHADSAKGFGSLEEADHFMAHAQRLMTEWSIAEHEINRKEEGPVKITCDKIQCKFDYYGPWEGRLACSIAKYFFVEAYWNPRMPGMKFKYIPNTKPIPGWVSFTGTESNVAAILYVFDFYRNNINELAWKAYSEYKLAIPQHQWMNARKFILSFYLGAEQGLSAKLYKEFKRNTTEMGVVPSYGVEIAKYYEENNVRVKSVKSTFDADQEAYLTGVLQGQKLSLNKAIS